MDVVFSSIGDINGRADFEGNVNLINAAIQNNVKKFILVTSIGTGNSKDTLDFLTYMILKKIIIEKEKAEKYLQVYN